MALLVTVTPSALRASAWFLAPSGADLLHVSSFTNDLEEGREGRELPGRYDTLGVDDALPGDVLIVVPGVGGGGGEVLEADAYLSWTLGYIYKSISIKSTYI